MSKVVRPQSAITDETVEKLKQKHEPFYKSIGTIYCPVIKKDVVFNNYGWKHFRFDGKGHRRPALSIVMRFKYFKHVPEIVKKAKYLIKENEGTVTLKGKKLEERKDTLLLVTPIPLLPEVLS